MNKIVTLSLVAATSILMTGCGSSSSTSSNPTATPTATPPTAGPTAGPTAEPTPTATPRPETQPAPVNPVSVQQLMINTPVLQTTSMGMAAVESVTSLVAATITQGIVLNILQPVAGDLSCAVLGATQGTGSIHGVESSLAAGGNSYTIDFNQCTFDTMTTLSAAPAMIPDGACADFAEDISEIMLEENDQGQTIIYPKFRLESKTMRKLNKDAVRCVDEVAPPTETVSGTQVSVGEELKRALGMLTYVTAVSGMFEEHADEIPNISPSAALNDIMTITGSIYSEVNFNPAVPAGNVWTSKFSANNYNMTLVDNTAQVTKFTADMNGALTGNVNFIPINLPVNPTRSFHVGGTNDLSSTVMFNSASLNLFVDSGIVGEGVAHSLDMAMTLDPLFAGWQRRASALFNDSGDGFLKAYFNDNAAAYHGEFSLYNNKFVQERIVLTDPSAVADLGVARKSTYVVNGAYGMNAQGTPFVWNTQGAFTFTTANAATKTMRNGDPGMGAANQWDYQLVSGDVTIAGTMPINYKFLPDLAANPNENNGLTDGSIVMEVGSDIMTLPANIVSWLEIVPQPN